MTSVAIVNVSDIYRRHHVVLFLRAIMIMHQKLGRYSRIIDPGIAHTRLITLRQLSMLSRTRNNTFYELIVKSKRNSKHLMYRFRWSWKWSNWKKRKRNHNFLKYRYYMHIIYELNLNKMLKGQNFELSIKIVLNGSFSSPRPCYLHKFYQVWFCKKFILVVW